MLHFQPTPGGAAGAFGLRTIDLGWSFPLALGEATTSPRLHFLLQNLGAILSLGYLRLAPKSKWHVS